MKSNLTKQAKLTQKQLLNPPNQTLVEVCLSGIRKLKIKWNQTKNFNSEWEMNELKWISPAARKNREVRMKLK